MNGKVVPTAPDIRKDAVSVLTGTTVTVKGGVVGDAFDEALAKEGAEMILDRLTAHGFKVIRNE